MVFVRFDKQLTADGNKLCPIGADVAPRNVFFAPEFVKVRRCGEFGSVLVSDVSGRVKDVFSTEGNIQSSVTVS